MGFTMDQLGEHRKSKMKFEGMKLEVLVEEANTNISELNQRDGLLQ